MASDVSVASDVEIDAVLSASRALVGIAAASVADVEGVVSVPHLRILVMVATRSPVNLASVARALDVNPSNASRAVDRLLRAGLIDRRESSTDRRHLTLSLTSAGQALVDKVTSHRRDAIQEILRRMSPAARHQLAVSLRQFAEAAGEPAVDAAALLWPPTATSSPPPHPAHPD